MYLFAYLQISSEVFFVPPSGLAAPNPSLSTGRSYKEKTSPISIESELSSKLARLFLCDPEGILTLDLQNRNLTLYTAKLRGLNCGAKVVSIFYFCK